MMEPIEGDFVNDEPLAAAEQNGPPRRRRRRAPSVLEPPPRRREQIGGAGSARERTELFLRENPVPMVIGALAAGLAIGLAIRYASRSDEKEVEVKTPLGRINWSFFTLPFLDRKSTRLNSSHANISYAVFCLKKKKIKQNHSLTLL